MKITLGTIDVSDAERAAIAEFYGIDGLAPRDVCRRYVLANGEDNLSDLRQQFEDRAEERAAEILGEDKPKEALK